MVSRENRYMALTLKAMCLWYMWLYVYDYVIYDILYDVCDYCDYMCLWYIVIYDREQPRGIASCPPSSKLVITSWPKINENCKYLAMDWENDALLSFLPSNICMQKITTWEKWAGQYFILTFFLFRITISNIMKLMCTIQDDPKSFCCRVWSTEYLLFKYRWSLNSFGSSVLLLVHVFSLNILF